MNRAKRRRQQKQQDRDGVDYVLYADDLVEIDLAALPAARSVWLVTESDLDTPSGLTGMIRVPRAEGLDRAARRGRAPVIVFMAAGSRFEDPDAVMPTFSRAFGNGAGVVGGLVLDEQEAVKSAGFAISVTGGPYARFTRWNREHPKALRPRADLQAVPIDFLATTRGTFPRFGFRKEFQSYPFFEADYCIRMMREANQPVLYDPAIVVLAQRDQVTPEDGTYRAAGRQLLVASAGPAYDEFLVL